jgi:hypothetical protein
VLAALLRNLFRLHGADRERESLAQGLLELERDAQLFRWSRFVLPPLVHPAVAAACVPDAQAIAATLLDPEAEIDPEALHDLREFLCDGASSPLFGIDSADAMLVLADLRDRIAGSGAASPF